MVYNGRRSDRIIQTGDINIGTNIRQIRLKAGIKQTDLVKKLQLHGVDISIFSYNRIEKGRQNPTVSFLIAFCQIFECEMNSIFGL